MKSGCIDFVDFVDKQGSCLTEGDQHIVRTNHVTWLLAQNIRIELVMSALNTDSRKVETTRKVLSFHREDRRSDPNNPQSVLLDFINSCQNLRIWSLNTTAIECLSSEQLQKGKQIDEWWRQVTKGDWIVDFANMDDRSIGIFWVVSYTMAQPASEAIVNWLSSGGVSELLSGTNMQSNNRLMVMQKWFLTLQWLKLIVDCCSLLLAHCFAHTFVIWHRGTPHIEQTWGDPFGSRDCELSVASTIQSAFCFSQVETTVINQCTQLLSPSSDPTYVTTYINHSFPMHRQYLCAGAWILMQGHPENINSENLSRVLREFSLEEVTANIYTMVDVLLHHIQIELQHGHSLQDLRLKTSVNLAYFVWTQELLPLDILLLALTDRDDDPHALRIVISLLDRQELQSRMKMFCMDRGSPEHWIYSGLFKRLELQKAVGNHLSWKDRFTFVRDILAYFYGHLPAKLIVRILNVFDLSKIPFSESFPQHISSTNPVCAPPEYFATLLLGLVNNVIPPLYANSKYASVVDASNNSVRAGHTLQQHLSLGFQMLLKARRHFIKFKTQEHILNWFFRQHPAMVYMEHQVVWAKDQLPPDFHMQLYVEASRIIKESWWLTDGKRSLGELDSAVGYALLDPTWAAQDNTSTVIAIMSYEGQGGPVQANSKPRPEILNLCGSAAESLRPDICCHSSKACSEPNMTNRFPAADYKWYHISSYTSDCIKG
ncbi:hypothetical protein Tsubulata_001931 [Turnera subulata]|uniref:Uncharacterized protein n=1 Tax=Turnera subulata TaxID=218843 RepID=A0A9Q0J9B2_9ROSI|nr:hypothetical protein Tsubulata_001931 [Turnera subulata]